MNDSRQKAPGYAVAMMGARMSYAVPRLLDEAGRLARFYTDFSPDRGLGRLAVVLARGLGRGAAERMRGRRAEGIAPERIAAFSALGLEYQWRLRRCQSASDRVSVFLWAGQRFCERVVDAGLPSGCGGVFAFNSAALELFRHARRLGLRTVLEQSSAPKDLERRLLAEGAARFPEWAPRDAEGDSCSAAYAARERAEWREADLIVCGSAFVREAVCSAGGARPERCVTVPYGVDPPVEAGDRRPARGARLRVLTVGHVCLQKGSPVVMQAAERTRGLAEFRMVGRIETGPAAETARRAGVDLAGAVPRAAVGAHYRWADVFLLPSLCEGSATVCYEALSHGLPVICTSRTGSVVHDGREGFIVPVLDGDAVAERVERLARSPAMLADMAEEARRRAAAYTLEAYGRRLMAALGADGR